MTVPERELTNLRQALRTRGIDRRAFLEVAGAAALALGLSHGAAVAAPRSSIRRVV
jgi:hypothetical protein